MSEMEKLEYDECVQFIPLHDGEMAYCPSVYDGDTIRLTWKHKGEKVRGLCRIEGIDTPELRRSSSFEKELAIKSKEHIKKAVAGKFVTIKNPGTEKYGRILSDIQTNEIESLKQYMLSDPNIARPYEGGKKFDWDSLKEL